MAEAIKVLLVNRALPAHVAGGLERHVEDLALGLVAAGLRVHLLAAPLAEEDAAHYRAAGIELHGAAAARPGRYSALYLAMIGGQIDRLLAREPFDVVHAQEFAAGLWRPRGAPLVLTVHGTITSETPLHRDVWGELGTWARLRAIGRFGRRTLYAPAWQLQLARARRVLVDSDFTHEELNRLNPALAPKIRKVPLAVRETLEPPPRRPARHRLGWQGLRLLTLGRLEWQKGHEAALAALARLRHLDWTYTIAGEGSHRPAIERTIARLGLGERVELAGRVSQTEKNDMLAGADLVLWPERTHPAFGLVGLEALLAGTPLLATRRGAIPELIGERGGWLVESPDPALLAGALEPLLADPDRLAAAREGLRDFALERFAFDKMIAATIAAYREAIGGG